MLHLIISENRFLIYAFIAFSRPSKTADWDYDFFIEFQAENQAQVVQVVEGLKKHTAQVRVIGSGTAGQGGKYAAPLYEIIPYQH